MRQSARLLRVEKSVFPVPSKVITGRRYPEVDGQRAYGEERRFTGAEFAESLRREAHPASQGGHALDDWLQAEAELSGEKALRAAA